MRGRQLHLRNPVVRSAPLNRSLTAWWLRHPQLAQPYKWPDLMGVHHGTLENGPTWNGRCMRPGGWGSLKFDASNDDVQIYADNAIPATAYPGTQNFTVAFWCYITTQAVRAIISMRDAGGSNENGFAIGTTSGNALHIHISDGAGNSVDDTGGTAVVYDSKWHHVVVSFNRADKATLFVDGVQTYQTASIAAIGSVTGSATPFRFGVYGGGLYYGGSLDDIRYYIGRALSAAEARQLYYASRAGYPCELRWTSPAHWLHAAAGAAGGFLAPRPKVISQAVGNAMSI